MSTEQATIQECPIQLTEGAINEVKRLKKENGSDDKYLRVGVTGGGCAGFSYVLDFDDKQEDDKVYDFDGVNVIVKQLHEMYLQGTEVDYQDGLNDRGFVFKNPNADSTCGCGSSFSA